MLQYRIKNSFSVKDIKKKHYHPVRGISNYIKIWKDSILKNNSEGTGQNGKI